MIIILRYGQEKRKSKSKSGAQTGNEQNREGKAKQKNKSQNKESEFTQTTVAAQGGDPAIAEALFDFYSPSFKSLFASWLVGGLMDELVCWFSLVG